MSSVESYQKYSRNELYKPQENNYYERNCFKRQIISNPFLINLFGLSGGSSKNKIKIKNNKKYGLKNCSGRSSSAMIVGQYNLMNKSKKYLIKPSSLYMLKKYNHPSTNSIESLKNITKIPATTKVNYNNSSIEHNTINYIINNFNLTSKNINIKSLFDKKNGEQIELNKFVNLQQVKKNDKGKNLILKKVKSTHNIKAITFNKNNINQKLEEIKKKNEKLSINIKNKVDENKKCIIKINKLEKVNRKLGNEHHELKHENEESVKVINKIMKLIKVLKSNGLDVNEIMENWSYSDDEDGKIEGEQEEETLANKRKKNYENNCKEENKEINKLDKSNSSKQLNILNDMSSGKLGSHDEYSASKLPLKKNNSIPKLNLCLVKKYH